jgi:hypothetical protein
VSKIQFVKHEFSTLPGDIPIVIDNSLPTECLIVRTKSHDLLINFKTGKSTRTKRPTFEPIPSYGTLMTWPEFVKDVEDGMLDDDDGSGSLATASQVSDIDISTSRARSTPPFPWVTHVHWCGK